MNENVLNDAYQKNGMGQNVLFGHIIQVRIIISIEQNHIFIYINFSHLTIHI